MLLYLHLSVDMWYKSRNRASKWSLPNYGDHCLWNLKRGISWSKLQGNKKKQNLYKKIFDNIFTIFKFIGLKIILNHGYLPAQSPCRISTVHQFTTLPNNWRNNASPARANFETQCVKCQQEQEIWLPIRYFFAIKIQYANPFFLNFQTPRAVSFCIDRYQMCICMTKK